MQIKQAFKQWNNENNCYFYMFLITLYTLMIVIYNYLKMKPKTLTKFRNFIWITRPFFEKKRCAINATLSFEIRQTVKEIRYIMTSSSINDLSIQFHRISVCNELKPFLLRLFSKWELIYAKESNEALFQGKVLYFRKAH